MTPEEWLESDLEMCRLYFMLQMDPIFMVPYPLTKEQYDQCRLDVLEQYPTLDI